MPIETIEFNGKSYPAFQAKGNAARWVMPFALNICQPTGAEIGFDIGCNRKEWAMPGSMEIDPVLRADMDAYNLPDNFFNNIVACPCINGVDYIFSSHCLEHLPSWVDALDYWYSRLKVGGIVFLYLPDQSQQYWLPFNNRKHIHSFTPELLRMYFELSDNGKMWKNIFVSGVDLNNSFIALAEKI